MVPFPTILRKPLKKDEGNKSRYEPKGEGGNLNKRRYAALAAEGTLNKVSPF
jgi:hypothetical protein